MHKLIQYGLTFDDVLTVPARSDVMQQDVELTTNLTKKLILNAPIMSAAMDTVTESQMAIAIARQGGIGIIHKNMTIENQAVEVDKVKRSEYGVITDPFYLSPNHYVYEANNLMAKYHISGVPITENGKLVGIITNRDLRFETNHNKKIYEVMTKDKLITAPEGTTIEQAQKTLTLHKIEKLPIVDQRGYLKGLITIKDIEKAIKYPGSAKDSYGRLIVGASVGTTDDILDRIAELIKVKVDLVVVDASHGQHRRVVEAVKKIKARFPSQQLAAGNVVTAEGTIDLIEAGADAVKVGLGAGSVCTTRVVTGVGVPQVTAIYDCAEAAKPYGIPIIADGGIRFSGDLTKAIAAGAGVCMLGGIFAGCEESPGKTELFQGRKYKAYRGMESLASIYGEDSDSREGKESQVSEGLEGRVSYKGSVGDTIFQLMSGLRAGMSYCGCRTISELRENGRLMRISSAGLRESHPHDIQITKEAPNYSVEY